MAELSIAPASSADAQLANVSQRFERRVRTMPPGICPLAAELSLLQAAAAQTCGKCVPCAQGLPQMVALLQKIVHCEADDSDYLRLSELAEMVRATSDCAIGYEAANALLQGMDVFADEYDSHVHKGGCASGIGQLLPCEAACPAHVDVPAYIERVARGEYDQAVNTVRQDNPFPTACAFVCEHPCESPCRRTLLDAPVNIRGIKKYAVDQVSADRALPLPRNVETGHRVAVVGGGPSGLTCAYYLALMGHSVVVFEDKAQLGGMLRYGIPAYRFPRQRLDQDIEGILAAGGISVLLNHTVRETSMREIMQSFDAAYVAIGAQKGKMLRIAGTEATGVVSAVDMLRRIGDGDYPDFTGKRVAVVGGGNVAMDCARTAVRAHAEQVNIVYRRRKEDMTALDAEIESAAAEGVEMMTLQSPFRIEMDDAGNCKALVTQPQMIGPVKGGRPSPVDANKPHMHIPADVVLIAAGQSVDSAAFEAFGMQIEWGRVKADDHLNVPGFDGVFAGGDCQTGPSTVIRAIAAGKVAARNIDEYLGHHHKLPRPYPAPEAHANDRVPKGRVDLVERPARERKTDFECVEGHMSEEEVLQECARCLRCDHFGCGVLEGGRDRYV